MEEAELTGSGRSMALSCAVLAVAARATAAFAAPVDDLSATLEPIRAAHGLPALAALVMRNGKVVAEGAVGVRKATDPARVTMADKFHIGSCTKSMTATLIAMLVEEGQLQWNTTLDKALPDLAAFMDPKWRHVTITDLLDHRSGLTGSYPKNPDGRERRNFPGDIRAQRREYTRLLLTHPPATSPGKHYEYSNANFVVAGAIIERIESDSWENVIRRRLFEPLEMKSAGFGPPGPSDGVEQPWGHAIESGKPIPMNIDNPPILGPAGRVHCSLADWAKYAEMHARGETAGGLLKPATFQYLHRAPIGDYGFGWAITNRGWAGGRVLQHDGSNVLNYAVIWDAPLKDFVILVATNIGGSEAPKALDEVASYAVTKYLGGSR